MSELFGIGRSRNCSSLPNHDFFEKIREDLFLARERWTTGRAVDHAIFEVWSDMSRKSASKIRSITELWSPQALRTPTP